MTPYNICLGAYNAGNRNLSKEEVNQLASVETAKMASNDQPDYICFSFQEAANSWHGENLGKRIAKRLTKEKLEKRGLKGYTLVYNDSFRTMTKPFEIAKVGAVFLVRNDKLGEIAVDTKNSGYQRAIGNNNFNKGFVDIRVKMGSSYGSVICGHADSADMEKRNQQRERAEQGFSNHNNNRDFIIYSGDINERLNPSITLADENQAAISEKLGTNYEVNNTIELNDFIDQYIKNKFPTTTKVTIKGEEKYNQKEVLTNRENSELHQLLITYFCPLYNNKQGYHDYQFGESDFLSYMKFDKNNRLKKSEDKDHPYKIGQFDNFGIRNKNTPAANKEAAGVTINDKSLKNKEIFKNKDQKNQKSSSDHDEMTVTMTVTTKDTTPREKLTNKLESLVLNKQFKLGIGGSSHKININGHDYEVPRRVKIIHLKLTEKEGDEYKHNDQEVNEIINYYKNNASGYKNPDSLFGFGRTQSHTNTLINQLDTLEA